MMSWRGKQKPAMSIRLLRYPRTQALRKESPSVQEIGASQMPEYCSFGRGRSRRQTSTGA